MPGWVSQIADFLSRRSAPQTFSYGTSDPRVFGVLGYAPSASGISVTPQTAMRSTPVRKAVQTIAEAIGQLPIHVVQRGADGAKSRAPDHPAYDLLHDQANPWTSAADFFEQVTRDALLHGNGYAFVNRIDGQVRELIRLDPPSVIVERDDRTGEPFYAIQEKAGRRSIDRQDIVHLKAPSFDGMTGDSPVVHGREAIGLALLMEQHAAKLFANGARPSGILKFKGRLNDESAARIKASWGSAHSSDNSGGTAVLEEDGDFQALTFSSVDAQFLQLWQHIITEIGRIFSVPPHLLYEMGRATWGNTEEMGASFVQFSLMRWVKAWEGELRLKLFTSDERRSLSAEFLLDDFMRADIAKRSEAYAKLIASRVLNPNEVRAMENRPPYEGGDAFINPNTSSASAPSQSTGQGADA